MATTEDLSSREDVASLHSEDFDETSSDDGTSAVPASLSTSSVMDVLVEPQESPRNDKGEVVDYRNSFAADSPYFSAFSDTEAKSLNVLGETLQEISDRTKTFVRTGELMSEAARRLCTSCMLRGEAGVDPSDNLSDSDNPELKRAAEEAAASMRREAVGEEMSDLLQLLGGVLDEVASAQLNMVKSLEGTLGIALEAFAEKELRTVSILKQQADESTETAEQLYSKYLTGRKQGLDGNDESSKPAPTKGGIASSIKNWGKRSLIGEIDSVRKGLARSESAGGTKHDEHSVLKANTAANLRTSLEQIRLSQASAELKRFRLTKHLISIKHRRNFELGENVMASLHGMNAYYQQSADLVQGFLPKIHRIQSAQNELRENFEMVTVPSWRQRETALTEVAKKIRKDYDKAQRLAELVAEGDPALIDKQILNAETLEEQVGFWDLPKILADSSSYQRGSIPGVLMEGWLYKKSSAMIALQPWSRRWFVMDKRAIYYFRTDAETRKANGGAHYPYSDRVKVCDVVLCSVREIPKEFSGNRFCFQLVTPSEKPLTLQAGGPIEYKTWVDGIRTNIEKQLVHGDPHSDDLNKNIGKQKKKDKEKDSVTKKDSADRPATQFVDSVNSDLTEEVYRSSDLKKENNINSSATRSPAAKNPLVLKIMEKNPICADCGAPDPDWTSLNLGVLLCLECSAVHRSLGVHVSKVRSLKLDSLSDFEIRLLLALGNESVNPVWEEGLCLQKGWKKPTEAADRKTREDWIKSKYMWKGFLDFKDVDGESEEQREEKYSCDLFEAAKAGDMCGALYALSHGGNLDWVSPDDGGRTALHACTLVKREEGQPWLAIETAELLLQNGAKMSILDDSSHGVLDCALLGGAELEMVEFLTNRST